MNQSVVDNLNHPYNKLRSRAFKFHASTTSRVPKMTKTQRKGVRAQMSKTDLLTLNFSQMVHKLRTREPLTMARRR